jgi:hypothetical protein
MPDVILKLGSKKQLKEFESSLFQLFDRAKKSMKN